MASLLIGGAGLGWPPEAIFWELRIPRTALALTVGGGLGLAGAVLQGALRNPLADPGLLGIGSCAALGGVVAYYWGFASNFAPALPLAGLAGAALGASVLLAATARRLAGPTLILAGIGISALAGAALSLALSLAPNPFALYELTFWLLGGVADRTPVHLALALPPTLLGCALLLRLGRGLDALSLGEGTAATLGVPVSATLRVAALGTALAVGAGAAVAGGIGFVGLVVPHLLRPWVGARPGRLLWPSLLGGAALLLAADIVARLAALYLPLQAEPRLGVLTAIIGAPVLISVARRQGGSAPLHPPLGPGAPDPFPLGRIGDAGLVALVGPNGAGKTTILKQIAADSDPRATAYLEQAPRSAWPLTVRDLTALGRIPHGDANEAAITAAMRRAGCAQWADRPIDTLSGGEARRAMLARVLAGEPRVLLLDEPVADLDPAAAHEIMALLRTLADEGRAVVVVLHALDLARDYATTMVVLDRFAIRATGSPAEVYSRAVDLFEEKARSRTGHGPAGVQGGSHLIDNTAQNPSRA